METIMVEFQKRFEIDEIPPRCELNVCADSRYILYVNDVLVSEGPCRSSSRDRYYDKVDIAPYLKKGENILFSKVIHYTEDPISVNMMNGAPVSIESTLIGGFLIEDLSDLGLQTDDSWLCREATEYSFDSYFPPNLYIGAYENCNYQLSREGWHPAIHQYNNKPYLYGGLANVWNVASRPIPQMLREDIIFDKISVCSGIDKAEVEKLIKEERPLFIPQNAKVSIEIDPRVYQTAYTAMDVAEGAGAEVLLSYSEKNREDSRKSFFDTGNYVDEVSDRYILNGEPIHIEPFYYRAFRFLRIDITTKDQPLTVKKLRFIRTSYPLAVSGRFKAQDDMLNKLWAVSLRTLVCCMYETYMDCPFYEQMQYTMDTMLQMLYTYQISDDDRLARKAIDDFSKSQLFDGMLTCNAPSKIRQIIPGFSIYWIIMLHDHYRYFGDISLLRKYLPALEKLLLYFEEHTDGETGLIQNTGYWQFVDWVKEWNLGQPSENEDNYIYSMMAVYGYSLATDIFNVLGNHERGMQFSKLANGMRESIRRHAYDEKAQLYREVPNVAPKSMHAQLWAVLAEVESPPKLKKLMERALDTDLYKVSYCMLYFLLRAVEKTGLYDRTQTMWTEWHHHINTGSTTWPEDPVSNRSECHAWGSVPLYDYAACYLGVTPLEAGYETVLIEPKALWIKGCEGGVATCRGVINVRWNIVDGKLDLKAEFEQPCDVVVRISGIENKFIKVKECFVSQRIN